MDIYICNVFIYIYIFTGSESLILFVLPLGFVTSALHAKTVSITLLPPSPPSPPLTGKRQVVGGSSESPAAKRLKMESSSTAVTTQSPAPSGKSTPQPPSGKSTPSSRYIPLQSLLFVHFSHPYPLSSSHTHTLVLSLSLLFSLSSPTRTVFLFSLLYHPLSLPTTHPPPGFVSHSPSSLSTVTFS